MVGRVAVVAHVYYPETWHEIAAYLCRWRTVFHLYVTTTEDRYDLVREAVCARFPDAVIIPVPNRGRDIGPFLTCLKRVFDDGCDLVCKVHTKKSMHLKHGGMWRKQLYKGTLGARIDRVLAAFSVSPTLGILAPAGYLVPHSAYWESNRDTVMSLASRLGSTENLLPFRFAMGSMFWARTNALVPLLRLDLTPEDFPEEAGQNDGTLAHAIERLFPLAARIVGYETCDTSFLPTLTRPGLIVETWHDEIRRAWVSKLNGLRYRLRLRTRARALVHLLQPD
jgi:lipopolysaccharide biosynthesis protein